MSWTPPAIPPKGYRVSAQPGNINAGASSSPFILRNLHPGVYNISIMSSNRIVGPSVRATVRGEPQTVLTKSNYLLTIRG